MRGLLLVVAVSLLSQLAHAGDREDAAKEFDAGQEADRHKDWQTALDHYLRANELVPHPFAIYNIAVDYERLGKLRLAAEWYQKYLDAAPDSPDHDKVARTLAELKGKPASLSVRSLPDGANVRLDGAPVGQTPFFAKSLKGGTHHVSVDLDAQHDERDVELEYGEPADLTFTLGGTGGTLSVSGTPMGAYVAIDNITVGVMPATAVVTPGTHQIRVTAYGYTTYEGEATVAAGATRQVDVTLPRALGTFDQTTTPGFKLMLGYIVGASGGADLDDRSSIIMGVFGVRLARFEGAVRVGRVRSGVSGDLVFRWTLFDARVSPMLGGNYAYGGGSNSTFGYGALGGLRWDIVRSERFALSLLGEIGVRWYSGTNDMGASVTGLAYPLQASLEVMYR